MPFSWAAADIFPQRFETPITGSGCPLGTYDACYYRLPGLVYSAARRAFKHPINTAYLDLNSTLPALAYTRFVGVWLEHLHVALTLIRHFLLCNYL